MSIPFGTPTPTPTPSRAPAPARALIKFRVHCIGGFADIRAVTADAARKQFSASFPSKKITKVKVLK